MVSLFAMPKRISFASIMLILTTMVWIGADWLFGPLGQVIRDRLLAILVFFFAVAVTFNVDIKTLKTGPAALTNTAVGAIITLAFLTLFGAFGLVGGDILTTVEPMGAATIAASGGILVTFILAYMEEVIFRDMLAARLKDLVSNVMFGLYHVFVLLIARPDLGIVGIAVSIGILITLGFVWSAMRNIWGIAGSTGSHWIWNLRAFGIV